MSFVSSANLPSYFRGDPGNRRDRPTSVGWDVFIRRILNKRSNQVKVLLYRARIWITIEIFFLCKFKCITKTRNITWNGTREYGMEHIKQNGTRNGIWNGTWNGTPKNNMKFSKTRNGSCCFSSEQTVKSYI